jgi:hypothetical protein
MNKLDYVICLFEFLVIIKYVALLQCGKIMFETHWCYILQTFVSAQMTETLCWTTFPGQFVDALNSLQ